MNGTWFKIVLFVLAISYGIYMLKWYMLKYISTSKTEQLEKFTPSNNNVQVEPFFLECHKPSPPSTPPEDDLSEEDVKTKKASSPCSIMTLVPCKINVSSPCEAQCNNNSEEVEGQGQKQKCNPGDYSAATVTKKLVCQAVNKDVLLEDGTTIPRTEPGMGYCMPQLQAASLAIILDSDKNPCTYRQGCRWMVTDNHGNKLPASSQTNNIRLQRVCIFPQLFVPDTTTGDCNFQVACGGVERGQLNDFDYVEQARCTCNDGYYTMTNIHCVQQNVFMNKHEKLPYLPPGAIDTQYKGILNQYLSATIDPVVESAAAIYLVNPCAIDFLTGRPLGKDLLREVSGVYQCVPIRTEPNLFVCQMEDDYLQGNGGQYANCVFYYTATIYGRVLALDRGEKNKGKIRNVTQDDLEPIYGMWVNYADLGRVIPGFKLKYLEERADLTSHVVFQPQITYFILTSLRVVFYFPKSKYMSGTLTNVRNMACPVQEAHLDFIPTGTTGIIKTMIGTTAAYFSHDPMTQIPNYQYYVNYAQSTDVSSTLYLPMTPQFHYQYVDLYDPADFVRMFNARSAANPLLNGLINIYTSLFTGMILTDMQDRLTVPFSGANRYITDRYRKFITAEGNYSPWENPTPPRDKVWAMEANYKKPSRVCNNCQYITWNDFLFTTNCYGLETTRENGLIPAPNILRYATFTYSSITYTRK